MIAMLSTEKVEELLDVPNVKNSAGPKVFQVCAGVLIEVLKV